MFGRITYH